MRLFQDTNYNFIGLGRAALIFSAVLMVASAALLITRGPNFGIDFTGGVKIDVLTNRRVTVADLEKIRAAAPVEIHSIGRAEREMLISQKGLERAEDYADAIVRGRREVGRFKSLAEVAALPGVALTEDNLATVFAVTTEEAEGAKGALKIDINEAAPDNIRERVQQIIVDNTVGNLSRVLGAIFGVPAGAREKTDINSFEDAGLLKEELAKYMPAGDAAVVARNVARKRALGAQAGATTLLPSLAAAYEGVKISPGARKALEEDFYAGTFAIRGTENIGPRVSRQLIGLAMKALAFALLAMLAYIALRFKLASGVVAVISLIHDVLITLGLAVLAGIEIDLTVVAAFLTVVGYSINDTVVTYDRIREDTRQGRKETYRELLNRAINENLSRTLITGTGSLVALLILYFLGGEALRGFAFVLWVGIVLGTYSSIYVCAALLDEINRFRTRRRKVQLEAKVTRAQVKRKVRKRRKRR
ncbi:MAG: protein translocase subunit SecF [candidate division Zixibacteria bacterium]|nr:protein translocase subunit SecF [candidate division Zixibacteria bacterium]